MSISGAGNSVLSKEEKEIVLEGRVIDAPDYSKKNGFTIKFSVENVKTPKNCEISKRFSSRTIFLNHELPLPIFYDDVLRVYCLEDINEHYDLHRYRPQRIEKFDEDGHISATYF